MREMPFIGLSPRLDFFELPTSCYNIQHKNLLRFILYRRFYGFGAHLAFSHRHLSIAVVLYVALSLGKTAISIAEEGLAIGSHIAGTDRFVDGDMSYPSGRRRTPRNLSARGFAGTGFGPEPPQTCTRLASKHCCCICLVVRHITSKRQSLYIDDIGI